MTTAIILAGGLGTRLRSVVSDVPKPMAPIEGRPFLAYLLEYWINQGVTKFILSVGYKHEIIIDAFGSQYQGADLEYVIEQEPMGTGGGFLLAARKLATQSAFLLLNGDTYFAIDLKQLIAHAKRSDADWCFSLFYTEDKQRYMGVELSESGQLLSLQSQKISSGCWANGGVYWVSQRVLSHYQRLPANKMSLEAELLPTAHTAGQRLFGFKSSAPFIDIGIPQDYYRSARVLMEKEAL